MEFKSCDPKASREQAVRDAKCTIILDAALRVFSEKGYFESRLEDIAVAAGFSKASLYNYYDDKDTIFLSLAIREYEHVIGAIKSVSTIEGGLEQKLRSILRIIFSHFGEHFALMLTTTDFHTIMTLHLNLGKHADLANQMKHGVQEIGEVLVEMLKSASVAGIMQSRLSCEAMARYIGSIIRGSLVEWKLSGKMDDIDVAVDQTFEFIARGIGFAGGS